MKEVLRGKALRANSCVLRGEAVRLATYSDCFDRCHLTDVVLTGFRPGTLLVHRQTSINGSWWAIDELTHVPSANGKILKKSVLKKTDRQLWNVVRTPKTMENTVKP